MSVENEVQEEEVETDETKVDETKVEDDTEETKAEKTFTEKELQAELDKRVNKMLERKKAEWDKKAEDEKKKLELEKKGEFEELYNQLKAEVETKTKVADSAMGIIEKEFEIKTKDIPEDLLALVPDGDAVSKLAYVQSEHFQAILAKLSDSSIEPKKIGGDGLNATAPGKPSRKLTADQIRNLSYEEKMKMSAEDMALYAKEYGMNVFN